MGNTQPGIDLKYFKLYRQSYSLEHISVAPPPSKGAAFSGDDY